MVWMDGGCCQVPRIAHAGRPVVDSGMLFAVLIRVLGGVGAGAAWAIVVCRAGHRRCLPVGLHDGLDGYRLRGRRRHYP